MSPYELRALSKAFSSGGQSIVKVVYCPTLNHFIFIDDRGQFFLGDGNGEVIFGPVGNTGASDGSKLFIDYSNLHNCLLAWDGRKFNARRDFGGSWFLKTILTEKPNAKGNEVATVELTLNEAAKLLQYLRAPAVKLVSSDEGLLEEILSDLQTKVENAKEEEKGTRGHKWASVLLSGPYEFMVLTLTTALTDMKQSGLRLPILPILSAVIERFSLLKEHPFSFELGNESAGIDKSVMASEATRRLTFSRWPHMDYKWALPDQMAEAGFYHHPNTSGDDRVFCFTCTVCLVCWEPADEPWSEHERHAPTCPFVKGEYTQNVPISVVYASSSALLSDCVDEVTCVSTSSYCDWIASSTRFGEIILWNVAKELKKCDPVVLDPSEPFVEMKTGYRSRPRRHLRSGVAWADETEFLSPATSASPNSAGNESLLHEALETGNHEISNEIAAPSNQKGDFVVTTICTCGQPSSKRTVSEVLDADGKCSPALIVGCGITESKLRPEQRNLESSSPSSFVENLNTVNKAASIFNECILPPSKTSSDGAATSGDEQLSSSGAVGGSAVRYRPFILIYKIEELVPEENRGVIYAEKSRRTGAAPTTSAVDKSVLTSVKEIDESVSIPDDYDDTENGVDDKEALMDADGTSEEGNGKNSGFSPTVTWMTPAYSTPAASSMGFEQSAFAQLHHQLQEKAAETSSALHSLTSATNALTAGTPTTSDMATAVGFSPDAKMSITNQPTDDFVIKDELQPLKASLSVLQCLRLPSQFDSALYYVHGIVPAPDGSAVLVVVNRNENIGLPEKEISSTASSAILFYRLSFSCHMASVAEQPYRQIPFDAEVGSLDSVVHLQSLGTGDDGLGSNLIALVTKNGEVRIVNAENGMTIAKSSPPPGRKYTSCCVYHEDKLCVACDDGSVQTLELVRPDVLAEEAENAGQFFIDDTIEWKDPDLLVNLPLTVDVLKDLWNLTRSDWATSGQFSMQAPSSWVEVQQHQRLRKNPQHYLREEKLAKSWHLVPDNDTWFEHVFEITLPANFLASHIDFRFALHHAGVTGMPPLQVTFLRQLPTAGSRSGSMAQERAGGMEAAAAFSDGPGTSRSALEHDDQHLLQNRVFNKYYLDSLHAEVVAGPFDLHSALDLYDLNGLIQFCSSQLNNSKLRTFFIHVQALTKSGPETIKPKPVDHKDKRGLQRVASAGSASAMEKMSAGLYQQKYGISKYGVPTGKTSSAASVRVVPSRNLADARKLEDLKGCDWIQEVSVTVWRTKKTNLKKERRQRLAMARNSDFIMNLVNELAESRSTPDTDMLSCQQYLILDLLLWIIHQGTAENRRVLHALICSLENRLEQLFRSCYVYSNRTISRKFTVLIADTLLKIKTYDTESYSVFVACLKDVIRRFLFNIDSYRSSGSVLWLVALAEEMYKSSPVGCSSFIGEMQAFVCKIGETLKERAAMHCKTSFGRYGLLGFPFELEMFELPPPVLMLYQRSQQPFTYATATSTPATVTANFCSDFAYEENDWLEIAGVDYSPPSGTSSPKSQRRGRVIRLEREHLYGLIEVEPLPFTCYAASDGIKLENLDTGVSVAVAGAGNAVPTSTGAGPIPLPDMSQYEQSGNPALTNAVTSMKQQVQSILSKQMQLLAIQQQKQKLQVKLTDHVEKLANLAAEQIPQTQASSASTFGVPTTPKTTPFMTPTPLSPSHLSPINSEVDLRFDEVGVEAEERIFDANTGERRPKLVPAEFLKPPPVQALVVDRMSSGARKFVILSFDCPVLLTDLIVPQCGDIGSLSIDVWLKSESDDGQRLVVCNDISQKTLVLCDLQPPCLCQYLKITYIGRQGLGSCTSKIPLGNFYGYTYATPSQLFVVDGVNSTASSRAFEEAKALRRPSLSVAQLQQLEEDVACRYSLACELLRNLLEPPESSSYVEGLTRDKEADGLKIKEICREISSIRLQWNLIHRAIERMSLGGASIRARGDSMDARISYDKARVISELLFSAMLRMSPLMKLDLESDTGLFLVADTRSLLQMNMAVDIFERFCVSGIPCLTALSTIWILHHGAYASWWGTFFGAILDKFFAEEGETERAQKIFLILSFLIDRGLACGNNAIFPDLLHRLNSQLPDGSATSDVQRSFELTLILLSHSFDNFPHGRMVGSRWDFLLGEYSKRRHSSPKTDADSNNNPNRNVKIVGNYGYFKDAMYQSEELIAQHHQKVMQLSSELKEYVKNKSFKPATFTKHKTSTPVPYAYAPHSGYMTMPVFDTKSSESQRTRHPAMVDSTPSASTISSSSSQKKPRLKLPYELCRSVARKLASLILRSDSTFSAEIFILMCKVLSVICRCSRPLLHLSDVFMEKDQVSQLIRTVVLSRNVYARRALICLVQDFLASEAKCDNVRSALSRGGMASSSQGVTQALGSESSGASVESELEARSSSQSAMVPANEQQEANKESENLAKAFGQQDEKLASVAGASSSTSSKPTAEFGLHWGAPKLVETPNGAQAYIEGWVETIKPLPVTDSKISDEKRKQRLRDLYREILYVHATKFGLSWLQDTKGCSDYMLALTHAEQNLAKVLQTEAQYSVEIDKLLATLTETGDAVAILDAKSFQDAMDDGLADEALIAATKAVVSAVNPSITLPAADWELISATAGLGSIASTFGSGAPMPIMPTVDQSVSTYYSPMAPMQPVSGQNLAEAKDALWKLCEQLNASAAKASSLYMPLSDMPPPPPPPALATVTSGNTIVLDFGPLGGSLPIQTSAVIGTDPALLWDDDSDSEGTPLESETATPMISSFVASVNPTPASSAPAHLWKMQDSYSAPQKKPELTPAEFSSAGLENIQPISLALDERMESQLGWQAEVCIRRWLLVNNASLRTSLQSATSFQKPTMGSSFVQQRDQRISHNHSSSIASITEAFSELFDLLSPTSSSVYVENLLDSCWLLSIGNDTKSQEMQVVATVRAINLGEQSIKKLLAWLLDGVGITEKIWCLALRILATSVRLKNSDMSQISNASYGLFVVDDPNFPKLVRRLLTKVRALGSAELAGPTIVQAFFDLLTCIHLHLSGMAAHLDRFREMLVKILLDLLNERELRAINQIPLDTLNKLIEFLLNQSGTWRFDPRLVADVVMSLSLNLSDYLSGCDSTNEALLASGSANPRYCFLVGKPDLTTNEFRCFHDRMDVVMINLLKLANKLLNGTAIGSNFDNTTGRRGESLTDDAKAGAGGNCVAEVVLDLKPSLVESLLNAIDLCTSGSNAKEEPQSIELGDTLPVTAADATVQLLFTLMNRATGRRLVNFLQSTLNFLQAANTDFNRTCISDLSVYVLLRIFDVCIARNEKAFGEAGIVAVLAEQLVRCCRTTDPAPFVDYSHLLKSAAAVCGRGPKSADPSSKKLSDMKVDGMTNFAPLCSIASSSPMAHHLTTLLNSTPPHRRARSAAWSYHFYPAESWLDMTLTLPYTIMLKEIQIRPHLGSLQSSPSAFQVELSPDSNPNSFRSLAPPVLTAGCTKIRVSTESYAAPVRMVRLHFKRPPDSANLGMSQILLLGHSSLSSEQTREDYRLRWLQLLHHTLTLTPASFFQATNGQLCLTLSHHLVDIFLNVPLNSTSYSQLIDVLVLLEAHCANAKAEPPFKWLLERIGAKDCSYRPSSLVWLAELIRRLCSSGQTQSDRNRVGMLTQWVFEAVEAYCAGRRVSLPVLRCIVWSCSCVLWHWGSTDSGGRRISLRQDIIRILHKCARESDTIGLNSACGYLLCSIIRIYPEYLDEILSLCGLGSFATTTRTNASDERKGATATNDQSRVLEVADLRVVAFVSQSGLAVHTLVSRGVLPYLVNTLASICIEGDHYNRVIVGIVELLRDIANDPFVKSWLTGSEGSVFWTPLLTHVCLSSARSSANKDSWQRLESGTIGLLRRCISCHQESQRLVSTLLAHLLTEINGGLNGSIQQLILRVLLEDEKLTVATEDTKLIKNELHVHHPQFGCGIHVLVREVSIYANCAQLLPEVSNRKTVKSSKRVSYGVCSEFSDVATFYGGDSALTDVTFAGDKAKAKRISAKGANGDSKDGGGKQPTTGIAAVPVAYLSQDFFGKSNPLPGKLTVGHLYWNLLNLGYDGGSLRLSIRYGLPSEIDTNANEKLLQSSSPQSTLEVFARRGGLALLAEHLQLYQPTVSVHNLRGGTSAYSDNDMKILEEMQASANKPFLNDPELMDYYDPSYEWVNVASSGTEGFAVDPKSGLNARMRNMVSVGLSPHVVVCFGTFLRVAGYAELLVTQDRRQAQWLLRLAMGVTTDAVGVNIINNAEAATMGILPFEILSSLYSGSPWNTDEGGLVRTTSLDLGIPQLLLRCLAVFSHQNERRATPGEDKPEVVKVVDQLLAALAYSDQQPGISQPPGDEKSHLYWAKGTGFGTGSTQQHWNMDLHLIKQKQDEQSVACLLKVLAQLVYPGELSETPMLNDGTAPSTSNTQSTMADGSVFGPRWTHFVRLISDSCLLPTLQSYLRNDSVLDISRHVAVYESVMRLLCSVALSPQLCELLTEVGDHQQSLRSLLAKLKECVDIYISKLEPLRKAGGTVGTEEAATEEGLLKLVPLIERTSQLVQLHKSDADVEDGGNRRQRRSTGGLSMALMSNDERYMRSMKPLQFDSFKFLKEGNGDLRFAIPYHYEASVQGAGKDISALAPCVRRLAQEAVTLSTSLPLSYSSSVFVRTADERLDVMKVLIMGPCDTPYANGCFEFDVWFPTDYPNSPMHINLQTTGGSTVRFNPNLYNDGKVCLSILNTWHGRPEERWNAQTSSFLQVLVSIQSLILVSDPYFNEPGYERSRGTPAGQHASREYDANIRQATVRWGMLEMLRNPPACFKEVIHRHFWIKRDEITKQIEGWIAELESCSSGGSDKRIQRNLVTHLASLKRHFSSLKEELNKLTRPAGLEEESGASTAKSTGV